MPWRRRVKGEPLGLDGGDDGVGGLGVAPARGDVDGEVGAALVVLVDELVGDLAAVRGQVVLLVDAEEEDHGTGLGRVEVPDELFFRLGEGLVAGEWDDVGAGDEGEVRLVLLQEWVELVHEQEGGCRVREGGL